MKFQVRKKKRRTILSHTRTHARVRVEKYGVDSDRRTIRVLHVVCTRASGFRAARVFAAHRRIYFRTSKRPPLHVVTVTATLASRQTSSRAIGEESRGDRRIVPKYRSEQIMRRVTNVLSCASMVHSFGSSHRTEELIN